MRRRALTVTLMFLPLLISGCLHSSSPTSMGVRSTPTHGPVAKGTIEGRVFTDDCGGPAASSCAAHNYRGALLFCKTMNQSGFCPSAHVDRAGRYEITLKPGRYALIPAPGKDDVVMVTPRWVWVSPGRTTVTIDGGNSMF
jgi:hypothetical protein